MTDVGQAAALVLAVVFAWAAVAKLRALAETVASFAGLRLPTPGLLARVVPVAELLIAAGMIAAPALTAWPTLLLLVIFSVVIGRAVATGVDVPCACFGGGSGSGRDRPVSVWELVRNAGLGGLAVVATGAGSGSALWPNLTATALVVAVVVAGGGGLSAVSRRARSDPAPPSPQLPPRRGPANR